MSQQNRIIQSFLSHYSAFSAPTGFTGMTLGVVVDTDDPLQMGRLRIFCPALNDDPKQLQYLPWCVYASPFSGSINNSSYTRGTGVDTAESEGSVHYGFWAVPEMGAHVIVSCIDGDFRRRVWMACVPSHQETNTMHHGRWIWDNGEVEGPLTSDGNPIQPLYDNMRVAFSEEFETPDPIPRKDSPEWKTRMAEYQVAAVRSDYNQKRNRTNTETDQTNSDIIDEEDNIYAHDALGSHGYDWSGFKNLGAFLSSRTFGISTPGLHSLTMDDRPFNNRVKIKTTTGHQILLDDTNERIYVATNKGNNWMEMDSSGNIDVYSSTRISINAAKDINMSSGGNIRMFADKGIHMFAGHAVESNNPPLDEGLTYGEIRIESRADIHHIAKNIRNKSHENTYNEIGINLYETVGDSTFLDVEKDINVRTVTGDYIAHFNKDYYVTVQEVMKSFSYGTLSEAAMGYVEIHSFGDETFIGSNQKTVIKSMSGDVEVTAESNGGSVKLASTESQFVTGTDGIRGISNQQATLEAPTVALAAPSGSPMGMLNIDGPMIFGGLGDYSSIIKVNTQDIGMEAFTGTIIQKTLQNGHSYDTVVDKVDEIASDLNLLTYQTSMIAEAVKVAISAVDGSLDIPVTFDLGCLLDNIFNMIPQEILDIYATLDELNQALINLGHEAQALEDVFDYIQSIPGLDAQLGLDSINLNIGFSVGPCVPPLQEDNTLIDIDPFQPFTPANFRNLVHKIYQNGAQLSPIPFGVNNDECQDCGGSE